ncbi:unnamed protein product [Durusdinium trenchii]|uniref:Uncharacterized protein n=1 Tax=Durusdinium trenchii TaxID=1381693 RepID=A0ABP0R9W0_9DINO
MRGCTLSSWSLVRSLLIALAAAGAAEPPGATPSIPSCPAQVEKDMVAGASGGPRPSALLQMSSPRHSTAHEVHEDEDSKEIKFQAHDFSEAKSTARRLWDPYAIALGRLTHSNMILPVAAILSIAFSCSVVVCFVVIYRPRRSKNLDHQFGSVRLGLPPGYPGYGRKSHANCWLR